MTAPGTGEAATPAPAGWDKCGAEAVTVHRYACVHEHVRDRATCGRHQPEPGQVGCQACWDAGHGCPMTWERIS